jgi:hypothetical protein
MLTTRSLLFALPVLTLASSFAMAQPSTCSKREDVLKLLDKKYSESATGMGLIGDTNMIEVYVSEKGTFTILATNKQGVSCILAAGQNWEGQEPQKHLSSM